ncbi:hypothetical protein [Sphingobacterium yanglingense]|nr:hypothetical protein [Sphingobacterium yanglingense]
MSISVSSNIPSGLKKPRQPQFKKIVEGLHRLAAELQAVELV